jgi:hypothetical protein
MDAVDGGGLVCCRAEYCGRALVIDSGQMMDCCNEGEEMGHMYIFCRCYL